MGKEIGGKKGSLTLWEPREQNYKRIWVVSNAMIEGRMSDSVISNFSSLFRENGVEISNKNCWVDFF